MSAALTYWTVQYKGKLGGYWYVGRHDSFSSLIMAMIADPVAYPSGGKVIEKH